MMKWRGHQVFVVVMLVAATCLTVGLAVYGADYYTTPLAERPFHPQYDNLKPSGPMSHGYGIIGTLMIMTGVSLYSFRKRLRVLSQIGTLPRFLEVHIFLCLTGPILVLFHTTFKFGGLVAVSFWSMAAIVVSGIVGRYLYVQIPRGIHGHELNAAELAKQVESISAQLETEFGLSAEAVARLDELSAFPVLADLGYLGVLRYLLFDDIFRSRAVAGWVRTLHVRRDIAHRLSRAIRARHVLRRRILLLDRVRRIFHYWHVIHVPFSIIMFIILCVHVGVAIALGYTWIF